MSNNEVALPSDSPAPQLRHQITQMEHQFALAAPRGMEAAQIVRDALTALSQNPDLAKCEPRSVLGSLMTMAQLGLRVGVLGHGWLIPFWDKKGKWIDQNGRERTGCHKAQLVIGYQGLVALAYRSQQVEKITAHVVHENDHFHVEYGLRENLVHKPSTGDRGKAVGYYATVKVRGAEPMFYHMTREEMELYRDKYAMAKSRDGRVFGPWATEFDAMAKKTCVRQLSKFMPKGTDLAVALDVDDSVRLDVTPDAPPELVSQHIERDESPETAHIDVPTSEPPTDDADEARKAGEQA